MIRSAVSGPKNGHSSRPCGSAGIRRVTTLALSRPPYVARVQRTRPAWLGQVQPPIAPDIKGGNAIRILEGPLRCALSGQYDPRPGEYQQDDDDQPTQIFE